MQVKNVTITSRGQGLDQALDTAEELGAAGGLDRKEILRLRLLTEELIGMMRGITGEASADYRIEQDGRKYTLSLSTDVMMNRKIREQLVKVSTGGVNEATRGFAGKLREMIAVALLPKESRPSLFTRLSIGLMSTAGLNSPVGQQAAADTFRWSMSQYKAAVEKEQSEKGTAGEAWDELERSVSASIADEINVDVEGYHAEITMYKTF